MNQKAEMQNQAFTQKFTAGKLLIFVLPTIIAMLFASVYSIVDGVFVSNFGGTTAFAAVNQASPLFMIVASLGFMLGTGGTALVSKLQGEGDKEKANRLFSLFTYTLIAIGVICSIILWFNFEKLLRLLGTTEEMIPYCMAYSRIIIPCIPLFMLQFYFQSFLACAGKPQLGLIFTIVAGVVNVIGDAQFVGVFGRNNPIFAVQGAALATGLGLVVGGLVPLIYFFTKNKSSLRLGKPLLSLKQIGKACGNGISEFLTNVSASIVNTVYNSIFLFLLGANGVAAFGTVSYVNTIFSAVISGFILGVAPIVSYNYGAKKKENLQNIYKLSLKIIVISGITAAVLAILFSNPLAALFSHGDEKLLLITIEGIFIFALSFIFKGVPMFASGFFTSLNDGFASGFISVMRTLVFNLAMIVAVPLIFFNILGLTEGEAVYYGVWYSAVAAELLAMFMSIIFFKVKKKKYGYSV